MSKQNGKPKPIRVAALIRVSTEGQEREGESLRTQRTQIENIVENFLPEGSRIVTPDKYAGQEHATPDQERRRLDQLLADAQKSRKPFDAIMVADESRWSRDVKSDSDLDILRDNDIRFFVKMQEYDLWNERDRHTLANAANDAQYYARRQTRSSLENKIMRAEKNWPVSKIWFGRSFDKLTKEWGYDQEIPYVAERIELAEKKKRRELTEKERAKLAEKYVKEMVNDWADRYIGGESIASIAVEYGYSGTHIDTVLKKKSGAEWFQSFTYKPLRIDKKVKTTVPRLLSDAKIKKVKERARANTKWDRSKRTNKYLLTSLIFCNTCNKVMSGQPSKDNKDILYYRPNKECKCLGGWVRADEVEEYVVHELFETHGNVTKLEKAVKATNAHIGDRGKLVERIKRIDDKIKRIARKRDDILDLIGEELTKEQARPKLKKLNDDEARLREQLDQLTPQLDHLPTTKDIKELVRLFKGKVPPAPKLAAWFTEPENWEEKHGLIVTLLGGKSLDGEPFGVYVDPKPGRENRRSDRWDYTIHAKTLTLEKGGVVRTANSSGRGKPCR